MNYATACILMLLFINLVLFVSVKQLERRVCDLEDTLEDALVYDSCDDEVLQ